MRRCRITVMRKAEYADLSERYENPLEQPCSVREGQVFISEGGKRPEGLCESAWESMSAFVMALAYGAEGLFEGWMKNPRSVMISCNDGFRPVSFLVEALEEEDGRRIETLLENWALQEERAKQIYRTAWQIGDSYILKEYADREQMERSIAIQTALHAQGLPVAKIIPTRQGENFLEREGRYWVCQERLDSSPGADIRAEGMARQMGEAIGRLHQGFSKCARSVSCWDNSLLDEVKGWVYEKLKEEGWQTVGRQEYEETVARMETFWPKLRRGMIHRDVHLGNFLFQDGRFSGYIDFDLVQKNVRIFDLCYFLAGLLSQVKDPWAKPEEERPPFTREEWLDIAAKTVEGYDEVSPLSSQEKEAMPCVMEGIELLMAAYYTGAGDRKGAGEARQIYDRIRKWQTEGWMPKA